MGGESGGSGEGIEFGPKRPVDGSAGKFQKPRIRYAGHLGVSALRAHARAVLRVSSARAGQRTRCDAE